MSIHSDKNPNPQGKGLVTLLADWEASQPVAFRMREPAELLLDWFVSALVLSSEFKFRPAINQSYYLYARKGSWQLSLVAPHEWVSRDVGDCLGLCRLQQDMTWSIEAVEDLNKNPRLRAALTAVVEGFMQTLDSDDALSEKLPAYRRDLPYYQRMLATGLGKSLRVSVNRADLLSGSSRELLLEAGDVFHQGLLAKVDKPG
ncbi:MAG: DUF2452 domain-containing protein [Congregibacter sp.]